MWRGGPPRSARRRQEYARLGVREYFIYDCLNFALHGYRQSRPGAPYQRLRSRLGRFTSEVLGLDLALVQRRLRFFSGMAEVMNSDEFIERISTMMEGVEARAEQAQAQAAQAQAQAEQARAALAAAVLLMREQRGDPPTPEERARILACDDVEQLVRWLQLPPP